jgi:cytochrome c-type biogenesis protein CcmH/NrfG
LTERMIQQNRFYLAPYVLQGSAYSAEKKYGEAEKRFLDALQILPTQVDAVTGLAQAYYLAGEKSRALAVLQATEKYPFGPEARKHFDDLKAQYGR